MTAEELYAAAGSPGVPWESFQWFAVKVAGVLLLVRFFVWFVWA